MKTTYKGPYWGYFWTSNQENFGYNGRRGMVDSALESWDFILYDCKIFGYHRMFYGTQTFYDHKEWSLSFLTQFQRIRITFTLLAEISSFEVQKYPQ